MTELLKRWAELEPERCMENTAELAFHYGCTGPFMVYIDDKMYDLEYGLDMRLMQSIIEGAVQQAIEARGWSASVRITRHVIDRLNTEYVYRVGLFGDWEENIYSESKSSPAEALLAAYLQAIEATKAHTGAE